MRRFAALTLLTISAIASSQTHVVRSRGDLPATRYAMSEPASQAFLSEQFLATVLPQLRKEAERIIDTSRIEDEALDQQLTTGLVAIDLLQGRAAKAEQRILALRKRTTKPQMRALGLLSQEAVAVALQGPTATRCVRAGKRVAERLRSANAQVVRDMVLQQHNVNQTASPAFFSGVLQGFVDPEVQAQQSVGLFSGLMMAQLRVAAVQGPACREEIGDVLRAWLAEPANAAINLWTAREPSSSALEKAQPVVVAVWDSGIDVSLFAGQLAIDPAEPLDGRDNDNNGIIDDVHGPTWDYRVMPTRFSLAMPSPFLAPRLAYYMAIDKGERDLAYGYDTPESNFFAKRGREASAQEQADDLILNAENEHRHHGTFVASQIADGADFVRLYNVRLLPAGYEPKPIPITEIEHARFVKAIATAVLRMKGAGVRVANLSWWFRVDSITDRLMQQGVESDPAKARERATRIYASLKDALESAISSAPEILFVTVAGNSSQSAETLKSLPAAIALPNVLVVGATGQSGVPTGFTTFGDGVDIYARGEGSPGRMPGGMQDHRSGTSMAAPMVSRAAAQMLAVNPKLTTSRVVKGLLTTATDGEQSMKLLHAAAAVEWARMADKR